MKERLQFHTGLGLGFLLALPLFGSQQSAPPLVPVILRVTQETLVPGKTAALLRNHTETARVLQPVLQGRIALGLVALSGPDEVWTLDFYGALAELESDRLTVVRNPEVRAAVEKLDEVGGALLAQRNVQTATFLKDLSYQPGFDWSEARYVDLIVVHVRPGHHPEYLELRRMSLAGHLKGGLDGPLLVFKVNTGTRGLAWMIVRPLRSLGQHDELRRQGFGEILTPEEDAKMVGLRAASMEYAEERFFRVEPRISRVPETWTRRDPEFWSAPAP